MRNQFEIHATLVADEFIDTYMASANGEYVKVYLYILRHQNEKVDLPSIADALNHTEADVRRALAYWEKMGVLGDLGDSAGRARRETAAASAQVPASENTPPSGASFLWQGEAPDRQEQDPAWQEEPAWQKKASVRREEVSPRQEEASVRREEVSPRQEEASVRREEVSPRQEEASVRQGKTASRQEKASAQTEKRKSYGRAELDRLQGDGEFSQLLYVAGQYMGRLLKPQDADMLAYLYDSLHMSCDVIEYVIEYCVQNRHNSIRYMEKVALNWHEKGIDTVDKAKAWTEHFNQDAFAVMKAFGINDRRPGNTEWDSIERWYKTWGFSRQMVVEACNRTMEAIHKPSFQYADRILEEWHKNGIRTLEDISGADSRRKKPASGEPKRRSSNQFRNFEERQTDYDAMVLEQWQ